MRPAIQLISMQTRVRCCAPQLDLLRQSLRRSTCWSCGGSIVQIGGHPSCWSVPSAAWGSLLMCAGCEVCCTGCDHCKSSWPAAAGRVDCVGCRTPAGLLGACAECCCRFLPARGSEVSRCCRQSQQCCVAGASSSRMLIVFEYRGHGGCCCAVATTSAAEGGCCGIADAIGSTGGVTAC